VIGADFQTKEVHVQEYKTDLTLQVWYVSENQHALNFVFRNADVFILTFDLTNMDSFIAYLCFFLFSLQFPFPCSQRHSVSLKGYYEQHAISFPCIVVGTKSDLVEHRQVSKSLALNFCSKLPNTYYCEVSSKTGKGVEEVFSMAAAMALVSLLIFRIFHSNMCNQIKKKKGKTVEIKQDGKKPQLSAKDNAMLYGLLCLGYPVPLLQVSVSARVIDFVAQVSIEQVYVNQESNPLGIQTLNRVPMIFFFLSSNSPFVVQRQRIFSRSILKLQ
jgi:hypothetical protein